MANHGVGTQRRKRIRAELVARDGDVCYWCGVGFDEEEELQQVSIDHVVRYRDGGPNEIDNLVLAHKGCNQSREYHLMQPLRDILPPELLA